MKRRPARSPETETHRPPHGASGESPCSAERTPKRRVRRQPALPLSESVSGLPAGVRDYLDATSLRELLDDLNLGPLERAVAEERLAGATIREIAASSGIKKWRVERAMEMVRRRWRERREADAPSRPTRHTAGWQDVYLSETRRRGKP